MPLPIIAAITAKEVVALVAVGYVLITKTAIVDIAEDKIEKIFSDGPKEHNILKSSIENAMKDSMDPDVYIKNRIKVSEMASKIATTYNTGSVGQYNTRAAKERFLA